MSDVTMSQSDVNVSRRARRRHKQRSKLKSFVHPVLADSKHSDVFQADTSVLNAMVTDASADISPRAHKSRKKQKRSKSIGHKEHNGHQSPGSHMSTGKQATDSGYKSPGSHMSTGKQTTETPVTYNIEAAAVSLHHTPDTNKGFLCHPVSSDTVLLAIQHPVQLMLSGKALIRSIHGQVDINGFKITAPTTTTTPTTPTTTTLFYPLYAPDCNSFLSLNTSPPTEKCKASELHRQITSQFVGDDVDSDVVIKEAVRLAKQFSSVVLLKRLSCSVCDFVTTIPPFQQLFFDAIDRSDAQEVMTCHPVDMSISLHKSNEAVVMTTEYQSAAQSIMAEINDGKSPIVVTCGGKNTGKSSLARYLINSLLNYVSSVAYLECDVGQTEFTPSGCVALNIVTEPLLGAPFTHQRQPVSMCYVGCVSPGDDPAHYIHCVQHVFSTYQRLGNKPALIVNTMGWNKGIGLSLLSDVLRLVRPNFVLQLQSQASYRNFPVLNCDLVRGTPGWYPTQQDCVMLQVTDKNMLSALNYRLVQLASPVTSNRAQQLYGAPDHRSLSVLACLAPAVPPHTTLQAARPHCVPWRDVAVHVCHGIVDRSLVLAALNATLVALCVVNQTLIVDTGVVGYPKFLSKTPICECVGFGLVRSIDVQQQAFYVTTAVAPSLLQQVNCLLRGALELPSQILLNQQVTSDTAILPYVGVSKDVVGATSVKRRRHMSRKRVFPQ